MSTGTFAFLVGLFIVPVIILWLGHRLRRRTARQRGAFWGGVIGYGAASIAALIVGMYPAAMWGDSDLMRGALGFWSIVVVPVFGAAIGAVMAKQD